MLTLRPYQQAAKTAVYDFLRQRKDHPCVVIPTGAGKTAVISSICQDAVCQWHSRVLVLAHVKELLQQTTSKLKTLCPQVPVGLYSAGLQRRDTTQPVIVAGIQSVYTRACDLDAFDLVLVDEAHLIPLEGDGMYRQFLADARTINPRLRLVGFTATPFRLKTGPICTPDGLLNAICFEVGIRELIHDGYLCPLVSKAGLVQVDTRFLHICDGDYHADEVESLMDQDSLVEAACQEIVTYTQQRQAVLLFVSGLQHGEHLVRVLKDNHGIDCGFISGETPDLQRDAVLEQFHAGRLKYLANVNVLTTGFDAPHIDCIALLRPTWSAGLYYQMVGRGFRPHPHKQNCLILDFGGNVLRHGPVDQLRVLQCGMGSQGTAPAKQCPQCRSVVAAGYACWPDCGFAFPPPQRSRHDVQACTAGVLSGQVTTRKLPVQDVFYSLHRKRGAGDEAPRSMRVDYRVGSNKFQSEWVCLEHTGYARQKAIAWWRRRSPDPVPDSAQLAVDIANNGGLALTTAITVRTVAGDAYERIIDYELGPLPETDPDREPDDIDLAPIPF